MRPKNSIFTVLLVEDEPADAFLVRMGFKENKILVDLKHVEDGVEAFAFLQQEGAYHDAPCPDLILLDINMPRMDGLTFLKKIKTMEPLRRIPVVVLTTSAAESDVFSSYDYGAAGYVVKPLDVLQFMEVIRSLENYWITLVQRPNF
ncbi:MAG: response regulator [Methylobacter sp.]|nr:response regulator [Candidatus Methylobacter titanis]